MKKIFLILLIALVYQVGNAQDPMRTPKNPRVKTSGTVDGSHGKYVSEHKAHKSDFTKHHLHIKKAKSNSTERTGKTFASTKH